MGIQVAGRSVAIPVFLAPMSGITDLPFRRLAGSLGAPLMVCEMVASREMIQASKDSQRRVRRDRTAGPHIVQLVGNDPALFAEAAKLNADAGADMIDINMGCPVKKVVRGAAGSALMRNEALVMRIFEAVTKAVSVPVSVKIRLGWDHDNRNAPTIARLAEQAGLSMITVHGRTRAQAFKGQADWQFVGEVKDAVGLPIIVNGDIIDSASAQDSLRLSGADGVMIGRAAFGRPWLVAQIAQTLTGQPVAPQPGGLQLWHLIQAHYGEILCHYGRQTGIRVARKHLNQYLQPFSLQPEIKRQILQSDDADRVLARVKDCIERAMEKQAA